MTEALSSVGGAGEARPGGDVLLERERETEALAALVGALGAGTGGVALIEGEAGVGKTRLLLALREQAEAAGVRVLGARAGELEGGFPFGIVRQLFEPLVLAPGGEALLEGAAGPAARVFDPVADGETADASFAALHGLFWLTTNLAADGPLLLCVDDLHWTDASSLRFLAYLVRRLDGLPVLLGTTLRSREAGTDPGSLSEIVHDPSTVHVRPQRLTEPAVGELIGRRLGATASEFSSACHRATGGNPLMLRQLLKTLETEGVTPDAAHVEVVRDVGPRAVSRSVLLRLARLGDLAPEVARAVAVLGDSAHLHTVASLTGHDDDAVAEAFGDLARAEILRPEPPLGFVHPLVRYAVYHDLPAAERELLHGRAARMLYDSGAPADEVAAQLLSAPVRGEAWVVDTLWSAGTAALRRGAPEAAVADLRRAVAEPPAPEQRACILLDLGTAELLVDSEASARHLREAYAALADPIAKAKAAQALVRTLLFVAGPDEAASVAAEAGAELPPGQDDLRDGLEALECHAVFFGAEIGDRLERLARWRGTPAAATYGGRLLQTSALWAWTHRGGTADACAAMAFDLLSDDLLFEADDGLFTAAAVLPLVFADREEAMEPWERMRARMHRRGSHFGVFSVAFWRGVTLLYRGDLSEAENHLREAAEGLARWRPSGQRTNQWMLAFLARAVRAQGQVAEAATILASVDRDPASDSDIHWMRSHVEQLLAERRFEEAAAAAADMGERMVRTTNPLLAPWRSLRALALDRLERTDEAIALAHEELALCRQWGSPSAIGYGLRVLGTLEREDGIDRLAEAAAVLERSTARLEHAEALAAYGSAVRRARRPSDAREPLRRALEIASSCGAVPLAEHARSELYAAGSRPRTEALSGVASLTPSERRVAALAAEGQTNRDIAQALYVTPKTVEVHLSNAYRKLGIASRRELAAALAAGD